ncbi:MAG: hypothetical protein ACXWL2_05175 [Candidatus Chromulinivorax sp.]
MAFFNRIENETGDFSIAFYEKEFYDNLVSRHIGILGKAFAAIYDVTKNWNQAQRTDFCNSIRKSNEIKKICEGKIVPSKDSDIPAEVRVLTKTLFIKLYEGVLKGQFFQPIYGTRLDHYHEFKKYKTNDYEFCPACGLVEMKTYADDLADQYDHYLPKDIYPFSSVNFENLAPICTDCNSLLVKGDKDILSYTGKVFFPFDETHKSISIKLKIKKNNLDDLSKIEWDISYSNADNKDAEIEAWLKIYNIEGRHKTHVTGSINRWYKFYNDYMIDKESIEDQPDITRRKNSYLRKLKNRKALEHIALSEILDDTAVKASKEIKTYSRF